MRLLLDTHVWIWSQQDPGRLGTRTQGMLVARDHESFVSSMSTLELARLVAVGAIVPSITLQEWVERSIEALQARTLDVSHAVAIEAYALPEPFHKDPADRVLVSTARCHDLTMVTADERILAYPGVRTRDARR